MRGQFGTVFSALSYPGLVVLVGLANTCNPDGCKILDSEKKDALGN